MLISWLIDQKLNNLNNFATERSKFFLEHKCRVCQKKASDRFSISRMVCVSYDSGFVNIIAEKDDRISLIFMLMCNLSVSVVQLICNVLFLPPILSGFQVA